MYFVFSANTQKDQYATMLDNYIAQTQQIEQLSQRIAVLEKTLDQSETVVAFHVMPMLTSITASATETVTFETAIDIMQNQYNGFLSQTSFLFTVIAIVVALISILLPIFNYSFVQKDQIEKMEKSADSFSDTVNDLKRDYEKHLNDFKTQMTTDQKRLENMIQQGLKANEATLEPEKRDVQIPALSDSIKDRSQALYMQALVNYRKGDYQSALNDLDKAIELSPDNADSFNFRSYVLSKQKRYNEALQDVNMAIKLDSDDASNYTMRALIFDRLHRTEDAFTDLAKAIKLDPDNAENYNNWGALLLNLKRYNEAIDYLQQAIQRDPKKARYVALIVVCYSKLHKFSQAYSFLKKALTLDSTDDFTITARGQYHIALAKDGLPTVPIEEIKADFDYAKDPEYKDQYFFLHHAEFYLFNNQPDLAIQDLNTAKEIDPFEPEIYHAFALCYEAKGDTAKADEYHALADQNGYISDPEA